MNNKNISPLSIYTENAIALGELSLNTLHKAETAINNAVDNCCTTTHKISKNSFLNTFYILLNGMNKKVSKHKFAEVKRLIDNKILCCGGTLAV